MKLVLRRKTDLKGFLVDGGVVKDMTELIDLKVVLRVTGKRTRSYLGRR